MHLHSLEKIRILGYNVFLYLRYIASSSRSKTTEKLNRWILTPRQDEGPVATQLVMSV